MIELVVAVEVFRVVLGDSVEGLVDENRTYPVHHSVVIELSQLRLSEFSKVIVSDGGEVVKVEEVPGDDRCHQ